MVDIPGNITSTATFEVTPGFNFGTFSGTLEEYQDVDFVRVSLTAGQTYVFYGVVTSAGTDGDGVISLYDSTGALITDDDDGGTGFNSRMVFTAVESGDYFIGVRTWGGFAGNYHLGFALNDAIEKQLTAGIDNYVGLANERILAGAGDDIINLGAARDALGDQGDDSITGNASNNFLSGGLGNDTIFGGGGFDNIYGDDGNDRLIGGLNAEAIRGGAGFDHITGQDGSDSLFGGDDADFIEGGLGNDLLDGGTGADQLFGGLGDDRYTVDHIRDVVNEIGAGGIDVVRTDLGFSLVQSSRVRGDIENLVLTGSNNISGIGNALNNVITGNDGANTISGGSGMDNLSGAGGNDAILGENNSDIINGGSGDDYIRGGTAGTGEDILTGGTGRDRFMFASALEISTLNFTDRDVITDFISGQDRLDFRPIDADGGGGINAAFSLRPTAGSGFTGVEGELVWNNLGTVAAGTARTLITGDVNGDRVADFQLELTNHHNLTAADFYL